MSDRSVPHPHRPDFANPSASPLAGASASSADAWAYEYPKAQPAAAPYSAPHGHPHPHPHPHAAGQHPAPRPQRHAAKPKPHHHHRKGNDDYTLVHGGRQVRLGPVAFWVGVGTLVIMAGWTVVTATYFTFHDDVLKRLIARQADMQFAYEDRIAELRSQVDRIASRQLLDQEQFEQKLEQVIRKQGLLEQRAATLSSLPDMTATGSIPKAGRDGKAPKPSPINDSHLQKAPGNREAKNEAKNEAKKEKQEAHKESRAMALFNNLRHAIKTRGGVERTLARVQESLDKVEAKQVATLTTLEGNFDSRSRRIRGVLSEIGVNPGKAPTPPSLGAVGGPFVAANLGGDDKSFERQLQRIHQSRAHLDRLNRTLLDVPVRKPVNGEIDVSSGFGVRSDPFLRSPALHTGIDMRGDTGDPVRVTANGTVTIAGVQGGYGKLIEVDHGNGLATRYGHLSAIGVKVGERVRIGQTIGRLGSTGRSTGPHLHYETRVDGEAVNPQKYLNAGVKLGMY